MAIELDPEIQKLLISTFTTELEDQLQTMTECVLELEKGIEGSERVECLDRMFRAAHNIKGSAQGVGVVDVGEIAHRLESLLALLRRDNVSPSPETIDSCLKGLDGMREAMVAFGAERPVDFDLPELLVLLDGLVEDSESGQSTAQPAEGAKTSEADNADSETSELESSQPDASEPDTWEADTSDRGAADPDAEDSETVAPVGERPAGGDGDVSQVVRVALDKIDRISTMVEELQAAKIEMDDHHLALLGLRSPITTAGSQQKSGVASNDPAVLRDAIQRLAKDMGRSVNRLSLLSEALQSQARTMRLVPMSTLLQPMARSVRDIARELGKNVNYQVTGGDVEMDRPVLEGIKDPLMHLLRNAIDHGIETPDERRAKGKAETGTLSISVDTRGNQISVIVRDDGAGINVDAIVRKAVSKKLITAAEAQTMSHAEKLDVVFRPGFSSKEIITDISGRGVGLDVVLSSMRSLKGRVQLDSVEGEGSTFTLTVPLTLSTEHGLLVRAGKAVFALPITSVERVMDVDRSELTEVEASQALVIGGTAVPVRELAAVLDLEADTGMVRERLVVVVVAKGWQRIALLVDEIVGEREIVVKRFRPPLVSVQNVIGGALTGSGEVIVVLNSADVVTSGLRQSTGRLAQRTASGDTDVAPAHILVADDSITARTLETSILETRGYQVTATADGEQAWEALQKDTFDLVLSDVEMPLLNGFELTQRIKTNETYRHLPVVIVTSLASDADRRRGVEVGADAYIVKRQFETQALLEIIEQLI